MVSTRSSTYFGCFFAYSSWISRCQTLLFKSKLVWMRSPRISSQSPDQKLREKKDLLRVRRALEFGQESGQKKAEAGSSSKKYRTSGKKLKKKSILTGSCNQNKKRLYLQESARLVKKGKTSVQTQQTKSSQKLHTVLTEILDNLRGLYTSFSELAKLLGLNA